jgi:hypothetical protein
MSQKILKFAQRVNEISPELSVDALIALWEKIDQEPADIAEESKTCKHKFLKGKKANTGCKKKVRGDSDYCIKHKK